MEELKFS